MNDTPPTYPAIRTIGAYGNLLAALVGLAPIALALWALAAGLGWAWLIPGAFAGAVLWLVMRSYVEVLRILADTLMPR